MCLDVHLLHRLQFFCLKFATTLPNVISFSKGKEFICSNFYVDDGMSSLCTVNEAIETLVEAKKILEPHGVKIHKISSNCAQVLESFHHIERAEGCRVFNFDDASSQRALGVSWDPVKDVFVIEIKIPERPFTKRGVLAVINSLYDPFGFIAPIILTFHVDLNNLSNKSIFVTLSLGMMFSEIDFHNIWI